jgi:hypothetical protein
MRLLLITKTWKCGSDLGQGDGQSMWDFKEHIKQILESSMHNITGDAGRETRQSRGIV